MKKAFTLLEVMISITIFSILILFLYKTLDQTKFTNKLFSNNVEKSKELNYIYDILIADMASSTKVVKPVLDDDKNSRITLESNNTYHNAFYTNIAYMINSLDQLVRIESLKPMSLKKEAPPSFDFYEQSYIDVLLSNVETFEIQNNLQDNKNYLFIIKQKNSEALVFNTFRLNNTIIQTPSGGNNSDEKEDSNNKEEK